MNLNDLSPLIPIQRPCAIKKPILENIDNIIDEEFIHKQINLFEQRLNTMLEQINKSSDLTEDKIVWDEFFLPELMKIKENIINFIKLLKKSNVEIKNKDMKNKLDLITNDCFSMMLIGNLHFPK